MIGRRRLFQYAGCVGITVSPINAVARSRCVHFPGATVCQDYIPLSRLQRIYASQAMSEWCWAATISMVFGYYGHPVSQERIVREAYGTIENLPGTYRALFSSIDRTWTDANGNEFTVSVNKLFAPLVGVANLSNRDIADALAHDQPVIYCTTHHAMVLTAMEVVGTRVVEAWVMDPWPGHGLRKLLPTEMVPMEIGGALRMVATVDIS